MCVYIYFCVCVMCVFVYGCVFRIYACMCVQICFSEFLWVICAYLFVFCQVVCVGLCVFMYACVCLFFFVYMRMFVCVLVCVCICIHVYMRFCMNVFPNVIYSYFCLESFSVVEFDDKVYQVIVFLTV